MPKVVPITSQSEPEYVTAEAIGASYGLSTATILRYAHKGLIPGKKFKNGKKVIWRFDPVAVDRAVSTDKQQRVG